MFVIVPADAEGSRLVVPITRSDARGTIAAFTAANDGLLMPLIVIHRKSLKTELFECRFAPDYFGIHCQPNRFLTAAKFEECFFTSDVPNTLEQHEQLGYGEMVLFILDGLPGHIIDAIEEVCAWRVRMLTIPAHTFDQVEPPDVKLFALHTPEIFRVQAHLGLIGSMAKSIRMLYGFQKRSTTGWSRSPCGALLFRHVITNDESYWGSMMLSLLSV
jgi:hypothetical protein